jgi:transposase-like protein
MAKRSAETRYHGTKVREGDVAVRSLVREVLRRNGGNVSATAREMGCSRLTVRRARDGTLEDGDRTPYEQPRRTEDHVLETVLRERKKTGYGRRRLSRHLENQFKIILSEHTLRHLLERIESTKPT